MSPVHPGKLLKKDFLKPFGLSGADLARAIHVPSRRIEQILREERPITADVALRLARYFGTSAGFWMNLQSHYDLEVERDRIGKKLETEVPTLARV